ncbi:glycine--tRNA ligase subunit beta [Alteribacillus iranensis]|uniref:Glycine--tRNA ligase beta subunit n=1 Tax=Alteribacillus iranensis TaxID=930128 RepID=A0A1I1ZBR5_9BACI|nr:glycine--tRNA ligase subunit beta [Alteribacillus iranensis]SFE29129.1 glycyl-tRNA synthetase beta chain [Alteribacillus iranensis]
MGSSNFLLEIGLEEMPARFVTDAMEQLKYKITDWLDENRIAYESAEAFSTPRRLAVRINGIAQKQEDVVEESRGPSKQIAVDENGEWTKAARGFAKGQGIDLEELFFQEKNGTDYVFAKKEVLGKETIDLLPQVETIITEMNFPKNMRWGTFSLRYVRPIHWMIALLDNEVIPLEIAGVTSGRHTRGHRFLGETIEIFSPDSYEEKLREEYVIAEPKQRKEEIRRQLKELASEQGWSIPINEDLLEEVNNLVEYPTVLYGDFSDEFLRLPDEVLVTSMREHQRYFPVEDRNGKLLPHFVTIRNGNKDYLDNVRKGNEKVLRARLSDAQFFFEEDQKVQPEKAAEKLDSIVFQEELGTIGDKVCRIQTLSQRLAEQLDFATEKVASVNRAAKLSKFDLVTLMVDEFTELQGLMGEKYALISGEEEEVATAIKEHYQPKSASDAIPATDVGAVLSISDKLDTIIACFGIGLIPTGSQDPYGLRRQAAGIVQILLEKGYPLPLEELIDETLHVLKEKHVLKEEPATVKNEVISFFRARLKHLLSDHSVRYDIVDAVLEGFSGQVEVLVNKATFLQEKLQDQEFKNTVEALSRVTNIAKDTTVPDVKVEEDLFSEQPEKELFRAYHQMRKELSESLDKGEVALAWESLQQLVPYIHDYFEHVMVMAEDEQVKQNRLHQMILLSREIRRFANFQHIVFPS